MPDRTLHDLVADVLDGVRPIGLPVPLDRLDERLAVVGPSDVDRPVTARVTTTPVVLGLADENFQPLFDDHTGVHFFGVDLVEERKVPSVLLAYETHGTDDGLDLAYLMRFTMRVRETLTMRRPAPLAAPMKGAPVVLALEVAPTPDETGQPVVRCATYRVPEAVRPGRRAFSAAASRASTTDALPAPPPPSPEPVVSGDGDPGPARARVVAEVVG